MTSGFKFNPFTGNFDIVTTSVDLASSDVTGILPETKGGTNQSTYTTGDLLYASASNTLSKRVIGSSGDVLTVAAGVPTWAPAAAATPNYAISSSSGAFSTASASYTDVTNLSVTITTSGRPVVLQLVSDGSGNVSYLEAQNTSGVQQGNMDINFVEGSTVISENNFRWASSGLVGLLALGFDTPVSSHNHFYVPAAGTYTYKVRVRSNIGSANVSVAYAKLIAYEI